MAEDRVNLDFNAGDAIAEVLLKAVKSEAYLAAILRNQAKIRAHLESRDELEVLNEIIGKVDDELPVRVERAFQNLDVPQEQIDEFIRQGLAQRYVAQDSKGET